MTVKRLVLLSLVFAFGVCLMAGFSLSFAAESPKTDPKPTCGKTVEECQKAWEASQQQIADLSEANRVLGKKMTDYFQSWVKGVDQLETLQAQQPDPAPPKK